MGEACGYYWKKESDKNNCLEYIVLGYRNNDQPGRNMEAWIAPSLGSNMVRFRLGEKNIIDFEKEPLLKGDYTGTPVLYPTPNRVRNGMFKFKDRIYNQVRRGVPVFEHGLVHDEAWGYDEPVTTGCGVGFNTWIDFNEQSALFEAFPFIHRLSMEFFLNDEGIRVTYTINNLDDKEIPFGFGLHPYFIKLSGEDNTFVSLPADYVMDSTSDLLPTGRLINTGGTVYDLKRPVGIGSLDMDHVFTGIGSGKYACIEFRTLGIKVVLEATVDFSHLVLYSPRGMNYFCIENQTCSTDAHNLYDRGFVNESGLKIVPAGKTYSGSVKYLILRT